MKNFFRGIFDYLSPIIDKISSPFLLLMEGTKSISSKIGNFFKSKSSERSSRLKTSELEGLKTDVTKNQNNNFTINIQAEKNDNPESIANKVSQRVADYSRTFLYDELATAL